MPAYKYVTVNHQGQKLRVRIIKERTYMGITLGVYRIYRQRKYYTVRLDTAEHVIVSGAQSITTSINTTIDRIKQLSRIQSA